MRNYKRKSNRQSWNEKDMRDAINSVRKNDLKCNEAATKYNVPRSTLSRKVKQLKEQPDNETKVMSKGTLRMNFSPAFFVFHSFFVEITHSVL